MITLYHSPNTRAASIVWLLEELGVPYDIHDVDWRRPVRIRRARRGQPPSARQGPRLERRWRDSVRIEHYRTLSHRQIPGDADGPLPGHATSGAYLSWLAYRPGVMEPALISRRFEIRHVPGAMGWVPADEVEAVLNAHLMTRDYFLGDTFSAVDIMLGGGLNFMMMSKMVAETPVLKAYAARITDRPAFRKMMGG